MEQVVGDKKKLLVDWEEQLTYTQVGNHIRKVVILPLFKPGSEWPLGVFIAGLSRRLEYNEAYERFIELVGAHLATAIGEVMNRQEAERQRTRLQTLFNVNYGLNWFLRGQKIAKGQEFQQVCKSHLSNPKTFALCLPKIRKTN